MTTDRPRRAWHGDVPGEGATLRLSPGESHHLTRVLRLRAGDALSVFDGRGREWEADLVSVSGDEAIVRVGAERTERVDPELAVTLVQALCRPDRLEWVLQKGTEVGVASFVLTTTERVEGGVARGVKLDRWRRILLEAAKQCGRRTIPAIDGPRPVVEVLPEGAFGIVLHADATRPRLADLLASRRPTPTWLAVGPEGGFEDAEVDALVERGWLVAGLGPRILRTETAGTIASALVLAAWGDLGGSVDAGRSGS